MAETFVNVTEGSGKKLHAYDRTIGANTVLDEIVAEGEQYLASYTVCTASTSVATAAAHIVQVMAGASLKVRIRRIEIYQAVAATTVNFTAIEVRRLTTAGTGGTAITPSPVDPADAASGATAMTLPTVKGTEGVLLWEGNRWWGQTLAASTPWPEPALVFDFDGPRMKPLVIAAGTANGICVKNITAVAAASCLVNVYLTESNF